jgi:hypothetical protein
LNDQFAGHGRDGDVSIAFAGKEFPPPLAQRSVFSSPQHTLGALSQELTHIAAASISDAQFDVFPESALTLAGVEPDIGDELLWPIKTPHLADDGQEGKALTTPIPSSFMQRSISGSV